MSKVRKRASEDQLQTKQMQRKTLTIEHVAKRRITGVNSAANPVATGHIEAPRGHVEKDTPMADMPRILDCSVLDCSYNKEKNCGAAAITVGYSSSCTTFIPLTVKGGLAKAETFVGACQKADCTHNNALECTAASISVGAGTADCLSYEAR